MHIFFSGIGGTGIGPLALVAQQAGHHVTGSDKKNSQYIEYLKKQGISDIHIGQSEDQIASVHKTKKIDWFVYSSAVSIEQPDGPEFKFCAQKQIHTSKRDELLNHILSESNLPLLAIAGTHGKTTTTAMAVWLFKQLNIPIGYILPAKSSFAQMGALEEGAKFFIYECDEFDRNFLQYRPDTSVITGIDWDHPDIYPTRDDYYQAFRDFIVQSSQIICWHSDMNRIGGQPTGPDIVLDDKDNAITHIKLAGEVNRRNAWQIAHAVHAMLNIPIVELLEKLEQFPGIMRRFEQLRPGLYTDYAHTPEKIRGALQLGHEVDEDNLVVVYEGLHNTRQHFILQELHTMFHSVKWLYIVPSYLAREDSSLELLTPEKLRASMLETVQQKATALVLGQKLKTAIERHLDNGDTVLCLTAGGGDSLDEWLRNTFLHQDKDRHDNNH